MLHRSYSDPVHFLPPQELFDIAKKVFKEQKKELEAILPNVDIQHVGSSSVPGLWGKFDVDIQIRVSAARFKDAVEIMKGKYQEKHPQLWTDQFVIFSNNQKYMIDLVVTETSSKYDDFYRVRDALIADSKLLEEYNALKKRYEGKPYGEYKKAKEAFYGGWGNVRFLKY